MSELDQYLAQRIVRRHELVEQVVVVLVVWRNPPQPRPPTEVPSPRWTWGGVNVSPYPIQREWIPVAQVFIW